MNRKKIVFSRKKILKFKKRSPKLNKINHIIKKRNKLKNRNSKLKKRNSKLNKSFVKLAINNILILNKKALNLSQRRYLVKKTKSYNKKLYLRVKSRMNRNKSIGRPLFQKNKSLILKRRKKFKTR